jgi:phenylacetaldehyde dehydrogenase
MSVAEQLLLHIDGKDAPASDYGRWHALPARDRARVQIGRTLREMRAQLKRLPEWLEYFGALAHTHEGASPDFGADHLNVVRRVPLGVVGLITPWNHPLLITMKKLSVALAAGNSLVVKPSELGPAVPDVTGGTETGRLIAAAAGRSLIPVTAELGGKTPVIMFDDVDIDAAVPGALFAAFIATGQTCVQGARILISRKIYEPFVSRLVERTRQLRLGDPLDLQTQVGPLVSKAQREKTAAAVDQARAQGATVLAGGAVPAGDDYANGWFYQPTIVADVGLADDLWRDEVFGPVSVVASFDDEDDAVRLANHSQFGLAASVWTQNVGRAIRVSRRLDIGIVWINDHHRIDPSSPWGGFKDSGIGSENGIEAFRAYTRQQSLVVNASNAVFDWFGTVDDVRYS